jgi:hypothetical protein
MDLYTKEDGSTESVMVETHVPLWMEASMRATFVEETLMGRANSLGAMVDGTLENGTRERLMD